MHESRMSIEVGSHSFPLTRENIHDFLIVPCGNNPQSRHQWGRNYRSSVRAHISLSFLSAASLTAGQIFLPRQVTSIIFIQSVNFIDRKCSLGSELSEFEGINVVGDVYWIFERSATDRRLISRSLQRISTSLVTRWSSSVVWPTYFENTASRVLFIQFCGSSPKIQK